MSAGVALSMFMLFGALSPKQGAFAPPERQIDSTTTSPAANGSRMINLTLVEAQQRKNDDRTRPV